MSDFAWLAVLLSVCVVAATILGVVAIWATVKVDNGSTEPSKEGE